MNVMFLFVGLPPKPRDGSFNFLAQGYWQFKTGHSIAGHGHSNGFNENLFARRREKLFSPTMELTI